MRIRLLILILIVVAAGFQATNYQAAQKPYHVSMTVDSVRFYESGNNQIPVNERVYRTRFKRSSARYINWELVLTHAKAPTRLGMEIQAVWHGPTGNLLHRQPHHWFVSGGQETSHISWGFGCANAPCRIWEPGEYRVDFLQGEKKIGQGVFEIR